MFGKIVKYLRASASKEDNELVELSFSDSEDNRDSTHTIIDFLSNTNEKFDPNKYTDDMLFNSRAMFKVKCDYSPLGYSKIVHSIQVLNQIPSAKFQANIEWGVGITTTLSILSSPALTWLIVYMLNGMELTADVTVESEPVIVSLEI